MNHRLLSQTTDGHFRTEHSYSSLPEGLFEYCNPTPVSAPQWLAFNTRLAEELNWPTALMQTEEALGLLSGRHMSAWTKPLAQAYSGHQFGHLSPRLGDGRAILLAEIISEQGELVDLQLKGAGPTPFSRRGDGRAALGPVMREYLVSEAMHAIGVKTTRALAAIITGDPVFRETALPGAILTRIASSHLRIGTFQFAAMQSDQQLLPALLEYAIARHYPACAQAQNPALEFLLAVMQAQAALVAHWMSLGFVHGVMNTDNMSVSGETIDYGPCAFIDAYNPESCFSSIDHQGRYAYRNQPAIAQWNLSRLAESLLPCIANSEKEAIALATAALQQFPELYKSQWNLRFSAKLGLQPTAQSYELAQQLLQYLQTNSVDFTLFFRKLSAAVQDPCHQDGPVSMFQDKQQWAVWSAQWQQQLTGCEKTVIEKMNSTNPAFIPRNHQIEKIIAQALQQQDYSQFAQFAKDLNQPFSAAADQTIWASPPPAGMPPCRTFCGT